MQRVLTAPVGRMENEAAARFDGAAVVHGAVGCLPRLDLELAQEAPKGDSRPLVPDAHADRAILVVHAHRDHGTLESRIGHSGHREKQLAREETRLICHLATMARSRAAGKATSTPHAASLRTGLRRL